MNRIAAFKAYDIRGVYGKDITAEQVYRTGFFLPALMGTNRVLVGRDSRVSSPELHRHLTDGLMDAGADVYDAGLTTTPMVYFATARHGFELGIQITASHNPAEENGLKISSAGAMPVGYDTGLAELERKVLEASIRMPGRRGNLIHFEIHQEYREFLQSYQRKSWELNCGIDCSNGMAVLHAADILPPSSILINNTMDGSFPGHDPNPLNPANILQLQHLVRDRGLDLGIIFDGDADRVMFLDETGRFISPDLMIALLADHFVKGRNEPVLHDIRTSRSVSEYIAGKGGVPHMWKVGRAFATPMLRKINGVFGGELAGHYYFRDFYWSDSGMLAALLVTSIFDDLKRRGIAVSEKMDGISRYHSSSEINFRIHEKRKAMDALKDHFMAAEKAIAFYDFDGYRVEFRDWWFNVRPSNTEPYLRFICEAVSPDMMEDKLSSATGIVKHFDGEA